MSKFQINDLVITSEDAIIPRSIGIITGTADDEYKNFPEVKQGAYGECFIVNFGPELGTCTVSTDEMSHYDMELYHTGGVRVARPANGISLNGNELLMDDNGKVMEFQDTREAISFLFTNGFDPEEIAELSFLPAESQSSAASLSQRETNESKELDPSDILSRLNEKLDRNYKEFVDAWLKLEPSMLIENAEEIAATKQVYDELKSNEYNMAYFEYLLRFENPLEVVRDRWKEEQLGPDISGEMEHALWYLMDKEYAEQDYPLDEDCAPPAMEMNSQGGMC